MNDDQVVVMLVVIMSFGVGLLISLLWRRFIPNLFRSFRNSTTLTEARLVALWEEAVHAVATSTNQLSFGQFPIFAGPLPAAVNLLSKYGGIKVVGVDDNSGTPGIIPGSSTGQLTVHSYVLYCDTKWPVVKVAKFWLQSPEGQTGSIGYEFQNIILARLGQDVRLR